MKVRLRSLCAVLAWLPILIPAHAGPARNTLVSIHADEQSGGAVIRLELSTPPDAIPDHFSIVDPARIVLDLPATDNATGDHGGKLDLRILSAYRIVHTEERSRLVFSLTQTAPYTVRMEGRTIVLDIAAPAPAAVRQYHGNDIHTAPDYRGDRLSLHFQDVEVRAILHVIADFTGLNIITSDSIGGVLSLRLKDVPWDQALDIVLQARGLGMRRNGNVMWIAPHEELLARERLEPMRAEVFQLNYQKAEALHKMFSSPANGARHNSLLSHRGSAIVDQRTNQLFVTDTPTVLASIRTLLDKVDIAARQVLIEARIVEADDSFSRHLGVRLGFSARADGIAVGNAYASPDEPAGLESAAAATRTDHHAIDLPARAIGDATAGSIALSLFNAAANRVLDLELSALEADGKGRIVSSPRVVTADQQTALIEQGEEIPYQQATSSGATSTAFKKANLKLEVTPQITPDGNVILNVDINKDSRGIPTPGGLAINTRHVKTLVQVENGGTVVIGGIYTQTGSLVVHKVPLLGDIPILGNLFKNTSRTDSKTELLIFLTPRIVQDRPFPR